MIKQLFNIVKTKIVKTAIFCCIGILLLYVLLSFFYKVFCEGQFNKEEITFFITSIKDIFQIFIFLIVGVITVLSYIQASKTLFTPIKTEIFKMQIKAFEDILLFFQSKTETSFTAQFDFDFIVNANAQLMISSYITHFHKDKITIPKEKIADLQKQFAGAIATHTWAAKNFEKRDYFEEKNISKPEETTNPALILENWKNYEYGPINYSKKFEEEMNKLEQLISSPLLPVELKKKIDDFKEIISENLVVVGKVLNSIAQELPQKFQTPKALNNFEISGIWNRFNEEKEEVEPKANEILKYIRQYLKIDKLVK